MSAEGNKLMEMIRRYFAWLKHLRHEEMDTATSGLWGYWKREPFWTPNKGAEQ